MMVCGNCSESGASVVAVQQWHECKGESCVNCDLEQK